MTDSTPHELPKQYEHTSAQERWTRVWEERGFAHAIPDPGGKKYPTGPFTIVIPPPNVTGALHLGHALNNTLQDILIRQKRMQGYNALYMPGTDHAGIATQAVVEKRIFEEEKKSRHDLGRVELVRRIWSWKEEYEERILGQLRQLGCSCDWQRTRFTLDEQCARAVRETFFRMFRDGYIYRGKRLVNWDTHLQTSVADDETYTEDTKGGFWTFKYPVLDDAGQLSDTFIRFSTTRPETMLGDTAVCVHPQDERYQRLIGRKIRLPLVPREIPIIADALLADPTLGTGCVKVTPAHDPNDYACWQRQLGQPTEFGIINILHPDGKINENGGEFAGLERYRARKAVIAKMEELGLYEGTEDRVIPLKYSDRSKTPIEPYLSDQWFVKMGDFDDEQPGLAQLAMDAVKQSAVQIFPERFAKSYLDWLGEKRDWCISRQLWWGHRIPVWQITLQADKYSSELSLKDSLKKVKQEFSTALKKYFSILGLENDYAIQQSETSPTIISLCARTELAEQHISEMECRKNGKSSIGGLYSKDLPPVKELADSDTVKKMEQELMSTVAIFYSQDPDVLDTWFSSALWPHSTLGWPEPTPELAYFYPTSLLITSRDIITLWVARMVLTGLYNVGQVPFRHVYIHPKILDGYGETMSKSKGNGVDPLDVIALYGADALRFGLAYLATETQDVRMPVELVCPHCGKTTEQTSKNRTLPQLACPHCQREFSTQWAKGDAALLPRGSVTSERFSVARNFCNKLWNAARFVLLNLEGYTPGPLDESKLLLEDRWLLSRLNSVTKQVTADLGAYRFADAARALYDFAWDEFCSFYVEIVKTRLSDPAQRPIAQRLLAGTLDVLLRLLHPITPYLTEEIWSLLAQYAPVRGISQPAAAPEFVMTAPWPVAQIAWIEPASEARFRTFQAVLGAVREIRSRQNIAPRTPINFAIRCDAATAQLLEPLRPYFDSMAGASLTSSGPATTPPALAANTLLPGLEIFVDLAGHIDVQAEISRNEKELEKLQSGISAKETKLANEGFVARAPAEVVAREREQLAEMQARAANLAQILAELRKS
ncbi:MAG: valine--tRNA ligase [Pirellulales bacterium]|nr:valine--tRNA ligase [Pirellulales bacterium]